MHVRTALATLLALLAIGGASLLGACGGGSETRLEPTAIPSSSGLVASKLAAALGVDGSTPILWEKEDTSAWKDAELFANRIMGNMEVSSLGQMQVSVLKDETSGNDRTAVVRVRAADVTADYQVTMAQVDGQWKVTGYEVAEVVEAAGH